jgi:hypothetical protein
MGINHRRPDICMAEHFLDRTDVVIGLKKMGGETVPEGVMEYYRTAQI